MRTIRVAALLSILWGQTAMPQPLPVRISPHEAVSETLAGQLVQVDYGRPSQKGRKLIGKMVKYGRLWRTGADEAPVLSTECRTYQEPQDTTTRRIWAAWR